MEKKILFLDALIILLVFLLSYFWEFYYENLMATLLHEMNFFDVRVDKWNFVGINVLIASVAVIIPSWLFLTLEQKQKKLKEDIEIFSKFAEHSGQGLAISDLEGIISYANPAFRHIVEEPEPKNVIGKNILDYYPGELTKMLETEIAPTVLKDGQWTGELSLLSRIGGVTPVIESIFPVYDSNKNPCYMVRLITDITQQKDSERMLKQLPRRLIETQENERIRIASELHDSLAQNLLVINSEIQRSIQAGKSDNGGSDSLTMASSLAMETMEQINEIVHNLRPPYLDKMGFEKAVRRMADRVSESSGIKFFVEINLGGYSLPKELEINVFRIIQEAINNIMKHSVAKEAYIDITKNNDVVEINISDNGKGFDPEELMSQTQNETGKGLLGIGEKVKILDGSFSIDSDIGKGSTLTVSFPLRHGGKTHAKTSWL